MTDADKPVVIISGDFEYPAPEPWSSPEEAIAWLEKEIEDELARLICMRGNPSSAEDWKAALTEASRTAITRAEVESLRARTTSSSSTQK